jgi:lysozyme family protein
VKNITAGEVHGIYDRDYWDAIKGNLLPDAVAYVVFDGSVNSGPGRSIMWLQQALRPMYKGPIDGVMGMGTMAALKAVNDNDALIDRICDARLNFLKHLSTFKTFGRGWSAHITDVRAIGKAWATGEVPQEARHIAGGQAKAFVEDAKVAPSTAPADLATGGGVAGGGLAGTLTELQNQISPLSYSSELIGKVVVVLAFASAALVIGGIAYRWYVTCKAAHLAQALGTVPA